MRMNKRISGILLLTVLLLGMGVVPMAAQAAPSSVQPASEGSYTIGPESGSGETEFYLRVENPHSHRHKNDEDAAATVSTFLPGDLPKTGDYGWTINEFGIWALVAGTVYLLCDRYEKKY